MSSQKSGFPSLEPAFIIKQTPSGTIKSLPGFQPEVDADIIFGGDWLYFDPDKSHARLNFKGIAKTKAGAPFSFYYTGTITIDEKVGRIFAFDPTSTTIPFGNSTTLHTFEAGSPELKDLENCHWVGNGRFILGEGKGLIVESRISKVVASTDMD
ncbi:hypothetical protein ACO1O0_008457 [Amphichorda felina]